jgi:hypothetical protein
MKRHILILLLATASAVTLNARPSSAPDFVQKAPSKKAAERAAAEKILLANETKLMDAITKGDVTAFKALVDADAWSIDASGVLSVADFEKQLKSGQAKITESKLSAEKVLWIDSDNAVLSYTWTGKGMYMNKPVPSPVYASTLWTKRKDNKWLVAFHQETAAVSAK